MAAIGGMLAAAALKVAVGKVAAAAGDRIMMQWRLNKELDRMRETMESIGAVLEDAERLSIEDASVRLWLQRLTRASNDISDMFDEFEINTSKKSASRKFQVLNPCHILVSKVGMATKIKKITETLENISNDRHKYSFTTSSSYNVQQVIRDRSTSSEVLEAEIIGRDQEKQKVLALLTKVSTLSQLIILPIYGIGGIGKTTLAQLLFSDTHFKDYKKAWVYVSQTFDLKTIKDSIRSQLEKEQSHLTNSQEPDAASKKVLIVLDDLWENDDFKLHDLQRSLKILGDGCKVHVILTTRDADIARKIKMPEAYKIEPLSDDACWTIIKQTVGFEDRADKQRLEDTGKKIAEKCGGVALAARAVGFMLRFKNYSEWVSVKDSGLWNVSTPEYAASAYDKVLASLKLSYTSMQPYLRLCFAYCAIFPKGQKLGKYDLIYQWAALGFIKPPDEVSTCQHGENYIKQLLGMSFFQYAKSPSSDGQYNEDVTLFTMHDLVHDLARSIIGNAVLDASTMCNTGGSNCSYASLADCSKPLNLFLTYPDKIRALRFLGRGETGHCIAEFSTAKYLRVLDLGECSIQKLPSSIGHLKLLRYLNAPRIQDQTIPSCIIKLRKLIYLNLHRSSAILALPESIGEMESLMYLDLSDCLEIRELPESFGKLKNLVHLDLSNCSNVRDVSKSLGNLTQLQYLNLSHCKSIGDVPPTFGSLTELRYLNLSFSSYFTMRSDGDILGTLTKLEYLNLSSKGFSSLKRLPEALGSFTELKYLNLSECIVLEELPMSFGNLRSLVHLDLSNCALVNGIAEALCSLSALQYLNLSRRSRYFKGQPPLRGLPQVIGKLIELRYLSLSRCIHFMYQQGEIISDHIGSFLDRISTLSNLEHLELSHNIYLHTIPDSFCGLRKLHTLDLNGCTSLHRLPESIGNMDCLKFLIVNGCSKLDMSTLRINKSLISLPNFMVHAAEGEQSSSFVLLKDLTPPELEISRLENVKSVEETKLINWREKQNMISLTLDWTRGSNGFVEHMDLLSEVVPPNSLKEFRLQGYNNVSFPIWIMNIAFYLPNLIRVKLAGLSQCSTLPPLGQLPNLKYLHLEAMPIIKKIDRGFCGGLKAFAQLVDLCIFNMDSLEEWIVADPDAEDAADEFMFPNLSVLTIHGCHKLRLNPCPPRVKRSWHIVHSDSVLSQWEESILHTGSSISSAVVANLWVEPFMSPMHQWKLLHHLPALGELVIEDCFDLSSSSEIEGALCSLRKLALLSCRRMISLPQWLRQLSSLQSLSLVCCSSIQALPVWLGDLVSLEKLSIDRCPNIGSLPQSIQQMSSLKSLNIYCCPTLLQQWCELEENKMKIGHTHIKEVDFETCFRMPNDILRPWGLQNQGKN